MKFDLPNSSKPLAFSYVRMSTATQMKGDSLRRQTASARKYAEENGLFLVEDFKLEDIGVSAYRGANAEKGVLAVFLEAVKSGTVPTGSYLLVESFDRLSRDQVPKAFALFSEILNAGIYIATLLDGKLFSAENMSFESLMMSILQMSLAHQESQKKSERVGAAWKNKRANIRVKKLTARCPAWLSMSNNGLRYNEVNQRVAIVRLIFDLALAGDGSYAIARELNARGLPTFGSGSIWGKSSVTKILTNPAVFGEFQPHRLVAKTRIPDGDPVSDYFPVVVEKADFLLVQSGRRSRESRGRGRKGDNISNLFTNLARCAYCRSPMHYIDKGSGPKGGKYLKCSKSISTQECSPVSWRYADFELSFLFFCRELDLSELALQTEHKQARSVAIEQLRQSESLLTALREERDNFLEILKIYSPSYAADKLKSIDERIDEAINKHRDLSEQLSSFENVEVIDDEKLIAFIEAFEQKSSASNPTHRKVLKNRIVQTVEYLLLAPAGDAPTVQRVHELLMENAIDGADADKMRSYIKSASGVSRPDPYFKVGLSGNVHRLVQVKLKEPTNLVALVSTQEAVLDEPDIRIRMIEKQGPLFQEIDR